MLDTSLYHRQITRVVFDEGMQDEVLSPSLVALRNNRRPWTILMYEDQQSNVGFSNISFSMKD